MKKKANIFPTRMVKNIAIILSFIIILSIILPFVNIVSYGSQYRENTNIDEINEAKYPGYKELLKNIKNQHPTWTFTLFYTGLDWNDVIYNETLNHGDNLVQGKDGEWLCSASSCIESDGSHKVYEGTNWHCPSTKAVSYYMDPRNFLYSDQLFQFERLSYTDNLYTVEGIEKILSGTFMANTSPKNYYNNESYSSSTFSQIILEAGITKKVSSYHLAARIRQEVVKAGGAPSNSVTGTVEGYEGLYNFFNIGATTGAGAIERGLEYARKHSWTSPEAAILGGADVIASSYIAKGQDTLYLQKYNVSQETGSLYRHQYQANIQAAWSEGKSIYKSYSEIGVIDNAFNFIIPVYENMPATVSALPSTGYNLVTENIVIKSGNTNINIRQEKSISSTSIEKVNQGDILLRIEKGTVEENGFVWDKVVLSDGRIGYIASQFVEKTNDVTTCNMVSYTSANVNLRNGPGLNKTEIISNLATGTSVTIIDQGRYYLDGYSWDRVKLADGTQGYIASNYLTNIISSTEGDIVRVATQTMPLTLRVEPGTDKTVLKSLPKGTLIIRLEKNVSSANGVQWDKVKTFDGIVGYVSAEYLELVTEKVQIQSEMNKIIIDTSSKIVKCEPNAQITHLLLQKPTAIVKNNAGETIADTTKGLATGNIVTMDNEEYTIIKLGDANGDGVINSGDLLKIQKHLLKVLSLDNTPNAQAADATNDGIINSGDLLRIQKYLLGVTNIEL